MGPLSGPLLVPLLTICLALPASAQGRLPADNDGTLDLAEVKKAASALFAKLDRDHDGTLDKRGSKPRPGTCPQIPTG